MPISGVQRGNTSVCKAMSFDPKNTAARVMSSPQSCASSSRILAVRLASITSLGKAMADLNPRKTSELLMDDTVGHPVARGQDYVRNMRRGEIAAT